MKKPIEAGDTIVDSATGRELGVVTRVEAEDGRLIFNVPKALRELFTGSSTESVGLAIADMLDMEFDSAGNAFYGRLLGEALELIKQAAWLRQRRS